MRRPTTVVVVGKKRSTRQHASPLTICCWRLPVTGALQQALQLQLASVVWNPGVIPAGGDCSRLTNDGACCGDQRTAEETPAGYLSQSI